MNFLLINLSGFESSLHFCCRSLLLSETLPCSILLYVSVNYSISCDASPPPCSTLALLFLFVFFCSLDDLLTPLPNASDMTPTATTLSELQVYFQLTTTYPQCKCPAETNSTCGLVSLGCHDRRPQAGWLKQHKILSSQLRRLEV